MIELYCNGVAVDVPRGTSIAWKNTNILFAFDKASCERSLTFTLPATATNDTVFELCRLPQYVGQGFRRLYDAEYRDGLLVKKGYAYVTQAQKGGYNVTLVVGELTALKRLKDAGKVGEVLPDAAITVPKAAVDARQAEYSGMKVLKTVHTDLTQNIMPSWCFRPLLVDVLNELQVPFTLPAVAEDLRIMVKGLQSTKVTCRFKNVRHSDVTGPTLGLIASDKYNTLSIDTNLWIQVFDDEPIHTQSFTGYLDDSYTSSGYDNETNFDKMRKYNTAPGGLWKNWTYLSAAYRVGRDCKITFPSDFPDDVFIKPLVFNDDSELCTYNYTSTLEYADPDMRRNAPLSFPEGGNYAPYSGISTRVFDPATGIADTTWDDATDSPNTSLAGLTLAMTAGTYFILCRREDFACAVGGSEYIYDLQPRFADYEFEIEIEGDIVDTPTDWTFSKRQNSPDMTAVDMLKTLANVSGKVLYYTDANGITFEDLLRTDFTPLDLTSKLISIKNLKPRFADYDRANIVKYKDDDMTTQQDMISIDYESDAAMLQGEKTLQTLPFSCVSNSRVFVGTETGEYFDRARVVDGNNKKPSADVLLTINASDTYTQRVPLVKNATIQQLCKEPLTIEATLHLSNYEYSLIKPFSLIHLNGVDYVWTESSWQKGTATLTLSKLPLTLSEPRPTPPPALYIYYDYLESDGNVQYIDTGVYLGGAESIEIDNFAATQNGGNSQGTYYGSSVAWNSYNYSLCFLNGKTENNYNSRQSNVLFTHSLNTWYRLVKRANVVTIYEGETVIATRTFTLITASSGLNCYLFAGNRNGSLYGTWGHLRLGVTRMYDSNGVLVRDFRPAVRIADGVAGMHDVVNDVFYTNANPAGDNFLYGNI